MGTIILGAIIAGARDLSFDAYGYAVVFIANICTAIYLASIARIGTIFFLCYFTYHFLFEGLYLFFFSHKFMVYSSMFSR